VVANPLRRRAPSARRDVLGPSVRAAIDHARHAQPRPSILRDPRQQAMERHIDGERSGLVYRVNGVPQVSVAGKYTVTGQSYEDVLRICGELVEKERAAAQSKQGE
jgi:hypothetical protein